MTRPATRDRSGVLRLRAGLAADPGGRGFGLSAAAQARAGPPLVNRLSLYLLSPALIFSSLAQSRIEVTETLRIGAFMTMFVISIGTITWLVALLLQLDTIDRAA